LELAHEPGFRRRAASLLRAAANDLKRDDTAAEADLGLPPGAFAELTSGDRPVTWELVRRACEVWPLTERDLLPGHDDCPEGVRIFPVAQSRASARVLHRGGAPYYEYRDTAMSRVASYRPEWIRMLRVVDSDDPDDPAVRWNDGHLLYQFTYFVGPVNYYYRWAGTSYCARMETGDSVWGLPFAPHSFAARTGAEPAYILALTYGGDLLGDAQRELSVLGPRVAERLALPVHPAANAQGAVLRSFLRARLMTIDELAARSKVEHVERICAGEHLATDDELRAVAEALGVAARELVPPVDGTHRGVHLQRRADAARWDYVDGAYGVTRLAGDPLHPHTTALDLEIRARPGEWLTTYQHQYLYHLGGGPVGIAWEHGGTPRSSTLDSGDSAYVLPQVPIALGPAGPEPGRVLLLRIGGAAGTDVRFALGTMPDGGIARYLDEDRLWYRAEGSHG